MEPQATSRRTARRRHHSPPRSAGVGEIRDEFDREELLTVRRIDDEQHHVLGRVKVADFNRQTGWGVPAEPGDSLSGLVFNALGHPARVGESIDIADDKLTVLSVSGTLIGEVAVRCET